MTNLVCYGKYSHPLARIYIELVQSHFSTMEAIVPKDISIEQYRKAWTKVYTKVQQIRAKKDARHILGASTGPIYNTISLLLAIGWDPLLPDLWKHEGCSYVCDANTSVVLISRIVSRYS